MRMLILTTITSYNCTEEAFEKLSTVSRFVYGGIPV